MFQRKLERKLSLTFLLQVCLIAFSCAISRADALVAEEEKNLSFVRRLLSNYTSDMGEMHQQSTQHRNTQYYIYKTKIYKYTNDRRKCTLCWQKEKPRWTIGRSVSSIRTRTIRWPTQTQRQVWDVGPK